MGVLSAIRCCATNLRSEHCHEGLHLHSYLQIGMINHIIRCRSCSIVSLDLTFHPVMRAQKGPPSRLRS